MNLSIKTIFLEENEKNIFHALQSQGIDTKIFENHFENLFNKLYNNEVGYYIFEQNDLIYRLIILPKTISIDSITKEKDFVNYLLHYYRINNKYHFDDTKRIPDSLLSLAFENMNNENNNSHLPLEAFEFYKYEAILYRIERFFKNHKNYKKVTLDYKSQDIKHKLHLANNIKEIDKTKIHQIQTVDILYSQIATISYHALKLFISHRMEKINPIYQKNLISDTKKILSFIATKFTIDKSYKISLSKLNNLRTLKTFNAKSDTRQLLVELKSLFGFEQMYQDEEVYVSNRYDLKTTSFFINPAIFYEWYVYNILKDFAGETYQLLFDKDKNNKTTIKYDLTSLHHNADKDRSSNPDYILIDEEKKIKLVFDAKWKNIDKLGSIQSSDFLKLKHDTSLLKDGEYKTISYLIYPKYLSSKDNIRIAKSNVEFFNFGILQIDMYFDKDKNTIDFKYNYDQIEEQVKNQTAIAIKKDKSEKIADEVSVLRSAIITKLLNDEEIDTKEEMFNDLDNHLVQASFELKKEIDEKISADVQAILDGHEKILEEDSIKFLKTSSSIYEYYKNKKYEHFDYSMPASGLWKLIELELNTSFIWYVRMKKNICDKSSPWKSLFDRKTDITHEIDKRKKVKLNQLEYSTDKLQGVMLGGIELLLNDTDIRDYFTGLADIKLLSEQFLRNVINLRNEHAHIKAMSLEKYNELFDLLFDSSEIENTNLFKLLEFKKSIKNFMSN